MFFICQEQMRQTHRFGDALRLLRQTKGIAQDGLGMAQTNVSRLELCKYMPSWERVEECAHHLGVHPLSLFVLAYLEEASDSELDESLNRVRSELTKAFQTFKENDC